MAPVSSRIKAIALTTAAVALGAALDSLTAANLGFLGDWTTVGTLALATGIGWAKTDTSMGKFLRRYGHPEAAKLIAPKS